MSKAKLSNSEKVKVVLDGLSNGSTRDELAKTLNYKDWRGIDVFMRRQGYLFNDGMYVLPEQKKQAQPETFVPQPVRIVLNQLRSGNRDFADIAEKAGFMNRQDLTTYMKSQGWLWSSEKGTYINETFTSAQEVATNRDEEEKDKSFDPNSTKKEQSGPEVSDFKHFLPLLRFLDEHQDRLEDLLSASLESTQIPHYTLGGITVTKSVSMASSLDQLIRDFSSEMGVSQRTIFEAALIQFMEKYGYAEQLKTLLQK